MPRSRLLCLCGKCIDDGGILRKNLSKEGTVKMSAFGDKLDLWIWFSLAVSPGLAVASDILYYFKYNIENIYNADEEEYSKIDDLKDKIIEKLCDKSLSEAEKIREYCAQNEIGIMTVADKIYPSRLRMLPDKPVLLYYKGTLKNIDDNVCISVVGTRTMTDYGKRAAYSISYDMAQSGAVIVSGLARGIDGMAHRGCLDAGGQTIAVLGCGIDRIYPSEHEALMKEIMSSGLVITEYKPGTPPNGYNFPIRNRIISGLSNGTLVIEAPSGSGALITAKKALLQGKRVFALPGKVGEINSTGTNELIRNGAAIITGAADILVEYQDAYPGKIDLGKIPAMRSKNYKSPIKRVASGTKALPSSKDIESYRDFDKNYKRSENILTSKPPLQEQKPKEAADQIGNAPQIDEAKRKKIEEKASKLTGNNKKVYEALSGKQCTADQIASIAGMNISSVMACLTFLEIMGLVKALPGSLYMTV